MGRLLNLHMKHTIFTPVYNRAGNMFDLAKHISEIDYSKSNFEWLIIDDGSTDNLKEVLDVSFQNWRID